MHMVEPLDGMTTVGLRLEERRCAHCDAILFEPPGERAGPCPVCGEVGRGATFLVHNADLDAVAGQREDQAARPHPPADPTKVQGAPASDLGSRSPFEHPKRLSLTDRRTSSQIRAIIFSSSSSTMYSSSVSLRSARNSSSDGRLAPVAGYR